MAERDRVRNTLADQEIEGRKLLFAGIATFVDGVLTGDPTTDRDAIVLVLGYNETARATENI